MEDWDWLPVPPSPDTTVAQIEAQIPKMGHTPISGDRRLDGRAFDSRIIAEELRDFVYVPPVFNAIDRALKERGMGIVFDPDNNGGRR